LPLILVVARDFPDATSINYTSPWAGAHYRPVPGASTQLQQEIKWAEHGYRVFEHIAKDEPAAGIQFLEGIEHFESNPPQEYLDDIRECLDPKFRRNFTADHDQTKRLNAYRHLINSLRQLSSSDLPSGVHWGISYRSFAINSPVYCSHLLRKFVMLGGRTKQYTLANLKEVFHLADNIALVANCSGTGFADQKSYIIRGTSNFPLTTFLQLRREPSHLPIS
jgi:D-amino-acid oxidase